MPQDANGSEITVGDKVNVRCTVVGFRGPNEPYNVILKTERTTAPAVIEPFTFSVNNKHIVKDK